MDKNVSSMVKSLDNEPTTRYKTKDGFKTFEEIVNDAVKNHLEKENGSNFVYKTDNQSEFLYAIHGIDFLLTLWSVDDELWRRIKWGNQYSEETKQVYQDIRGLIRAEMEGRNLSLDMLK